MYIFMGISRQAVHKQINKEQAEQKLISTIRDQVIQYRLHRDRRAGSRNLYYNLKIKETYNLGVTKFEQLMSKHGLTLHQIKTKVVTTRSDFRSWSYTNEVKGMLVNKINQVIAGDLTYVYYGRKLYYLFCLTDLWSMRIVGYHIDERMRSREAIAALQMAIETRKTGGLKGCIHHTDGGSQYFSKAYLAISKSNFKKISVAKTCIENGYAEQKNGLLKNHFIPTIQACNIKEFRKELAACIEFYNEQRKQECLGWKSPIEFEIIQQEGREKPIHRCLK